MPRIFVSYRREDSADAAGRIYDRLESHFGRESVFIDVDTIPLRSARTVAGWQHWLDAVAGWLREGRSPTVFIHTPDNVAALELARRFHDGVRSLVPEVEPLPEPIPSGPPTLF